MDNGCLEINQALPNSHLSTVTEIISQKGTNIQGNLVHLLYENVS